MKRAYFATLRIQIKKTGIIHPKYNIKVGMPMARGGWKYRDITVNSLNGQYEINLGVGILTDTKMQEIIKKIENSWKI